MILAMTSDLYKSFLTKNPSIKERLELGKSLRKRVSRASIGDFTVENKRHFPVEILLEQADRKSVV